MIWEIDKKTHAFLIWWSIPQDLNIMEKTPMLWKLHGNQFLKLSPNSNGFVAISHDMGNWWENPCISHMMKYTTRFESNGEKHPYYGNCMGTNFLGFPHSNILLPFPIILEIDGKTHAFSMWWSIPQDLNLMEKTPIILWELHGNQFPSLSPFGRCCCLFPWYGKLMRKPMHFPYDEVYHKIWI